MIKVEILLLSIYSPALPDLSGEPLGGTLWLELRYDKGEYKRKSGQTSFDLYPLSFEPLVGFEPTTPRLQITCSGQLS